MNRSVAARGLIIVMLLFSSVIPLTALAQQNRLPSAIVTCNGPDCTVCDLANLAQNVLNTGIYIAVFLSSFLFAWAGWTYMTAMGSTHKVASAKKAFTNVAVGLVIILIGWLVIDTLMKTLMGSNSGFGAWNKICWFLIEYGSALV